MFYVTSAIFIIIQGTGNQFGGGITEKKYSVEPKYLNILQQTLQQQIHNEKIIIFS